jgi:hypothetical protein
MHAATCSVTPRTTSPEECVDREGEVVATHRPMGFKAAISLHRVAAIFMQMLVSPLGDPQA